MMKVIVRIVEEEEVDVINKTVLLLRLTN